MPSTPSHVIRRLVATPVESERFNVQEWALATSESNESRLFIDHPGVAAVLATRPGQVLLIENVRVNLGLTLMEIPAGTLMRGEDPMAAAKRELLEETGHSTDDWTKLAEFYASPGTSNELVHLFHARNVEEVGPPSLDPFEDLSVAVLTPAEATSLIKQGAIVDAKTLIALGLFMAE